jgi:hypothetical protein
MKIKVTQHDIDRGLKGIMCGCPIALAAARTFNKPCGVSIFLYVGFSRENPKKYSEERYSLPQEAANFISNFDNGHKVRPFEFDAIPYLERTGGL